MLKQREIVLVPFPYSDLSATKKRPVLILSNNGYNNKFNDVLACVITSNIYKDEYSVSLLDEDLEIGLLPAVSVIKCHKLMLRFVSSRTVVMKEAVSPLCKN